MPRNSQPFRPYRRTDPTPFRHERPKLTPYEPPIYHVGQVVCCSDGSDREIQKVTARDRLWAYEWRDNNSLSSGVTVERYLIKLDVFNEPPKVTWKKRS